MPERSKKAKKIGREMLLSLRLRKPNEGVMPSVRKQVGQELSQREKYVIAAAALLGDTDVVNIYILAANAPIQSFAAAMEQTAKKAALWWQARAVRQYREEVATRLEDIRRDAAAEALAAAGKEMAAAEEDGSTSRPLQPAGKGVRDFRDSAQILAYLNERANAELDPDKADDIVLALAKLVGAKEEAAARDGERQRYYLPLSCTQCSLYQLGADGIAAAVNDNKKAEAAKPLPG